ncbi:MAG: universal stress protein, UspA [Gammaproteobacteria bacterium]|nr:universal stress protein [Gammaproteobacteria bacterium]PCH64343.1 MAG: universal stress protein, UspA [Gammaproteobacteria bacterium]
MRRFKDILCVVEAEGVCEPALGRAVTLAENNQASLTVVDVVPHLTAGVGMLKSGPISVDLQAEMVNSHKQRLEAIVVPYAKRTKIETKVLVGTPFLQIIREVLCNRRDLVIKVPEHQDWLDRLFGSDDMHVLRKCPCPVWLIKPHATISYKRILAAVDVDDCYPPQELNTRHRLNVQILEMAVSLALSESAELHVVHAWEPITELFNGLAFSSDISREGFVSNVEQERRQQQQLLDESIRHIKIKSNAARDTLDYLKPLTHLLKGSARQGIPALAKRLQVDCIVMGTVVRTGISGFIMGNTAETILSQVDCSVLAIKPQGFVTPVTLGA